MAPRTGPRGVTNEDVANRAGVTYVYRPETPAQQQEALLSYVLGGQAPGYGMKYGGFPTAGYGQAAIEGQAYGIADLARQAAQQAAIREAELVSQAGIENRQATAAKYRYARPSEEVSASLSAVERASTPEQKAAQRDLLRATMGRESLRRQEEQQPEVLRRLRTDLASQVAPYEQVSETLGYSPSQLAQQIAVSRYGYDPMLAAGLFGSQTDIKYSTQAQAMEDAQRRAQGYDTSLSNDEILATTLTPEQFYQYQLAKANAAYENVFSPDYSVDDQVLQEAYGVDPSSIVNIDTDTARQIMNDNTFLETVNSYRDLMTTNADDFVTGEEAANSYARQYLEQVGDPVRALVLVDILRQYSFLIGA